MPYSAKKRKLSELAEVWVETEAVRESLLRLEGEIDKGIGAVSRDAHFQSRLSFFRSPRSPDVVSAV